MYLSTFYYNYINVLARHVIFKSSSSLLLQVLSLLTRQLHFVTNADDLYI